MFEITSKLTSKKKKKKLKKGNSKQIHELAFFFQKMCLPLLDIQLSCIEIRKALKMKTS